VGCVIMLAGHYTVVYTESGEKRFISYDELG